MLDALEVRYEGLWTADDELPQTTRQFETKWRNRASFERQRLVEAGLLEARSDGVWALTSSGRVRAGEMDLEKAAWRDSELARRDRIWSDLGTLSKMGRVTPEDLRLSEVYAGARGIYVDVQNTRSSWSSDGVAVSFLHLGVRYANELNSGGVTYHFPQTLREGRDKAEVQATERAFSLGLPVFVIALADGAPNLRKVHRGFVERIDMLRQVALITFVEDDELPPPPPPQESEAPFELTDERSEMVWARRRARPHQGRFAFEVAERYGAACVVCDLSVDVALEAAHLRPKSKAGADDPRNGLVLCRNHHRMFDEHLFGIDPQSLAIEVSPKQSAVGLGLAHSSLQHLKALPHIAALEDAWKAFASAAGRPGEPVGGPAAAPPALLEVAT